jgi:hypothetical protein
LGGRTPILVNNLGCLLLNRKKKQRGVRRETQKRRIAMMRGVNAIEKKIKNHHHLAKKKRKEMALVVPDRQFNQFTDLQQLIAQSTNVCITNTI